MLNPLNQFNNLVELRLNDIPLLDKVPKLSCRYLVIGRLKNLEKLNGSIIKPAERKDADKYYLQQCYAELLELTDEKEKEIFLNNNPRYNELLEEYGIPSLSGSNDDPDTLAGGLITLTLQNDDGNEVKKDLPYTMTVKNLSVIVNHIFRIRTVDQILYFRKSGEELGERVYLDDLERSLHYYGIVSEGTIFITSKSQ